MRYDVFISSKSEDYGLAKNVCTFLTQNGLSVFLACIELDRLGEAEFALAIDDAIDNSEHMIVVATSLNNINSKWVRYEWSTFSNDLKSDFRDGNLITILGPNVQLQNLPASLRHQQSFSESEYQFHILNYLSPSTETRIYATSFAADVHIARDFLVDFIDFALMQRLNALLCFKAFEVNSQLELIEGQPITKIVKLRVFTDREIPIEVGDTFQIKGNNNRVLGSGTVTYIRY